MREYVRLQTAILLRRLAYQMNRTRVEGAGDEAVHDLRVAIRRLSGCLRTFSDFYPGRARKRVRRRLRALMDAAGEVRDRDIAVKILSQSGVPQDAPVFTKLKEERTEAARHLSREVHHLRQRSFSRGWREELGL
jgi:CHAD domain-containing protein